MTTTESRPQMRMSIFSLISLLLIAGPASAPAASSETDFRAAYAAAEAAETEAGHLRNQWTVTASGFGRRQEGRRKRRLRAGVGAGKGSRGAGQGIHFPGDKRKGSLEKSRNTLKPHHDQNHRTERKHRMTIRRRDFLKLAGTATLSGALPRVARSADNAGVYDLERFGNARILHMTDTHAQLLPGYFREPSVNLGFGAMQGRPPHLVGRAFLDRFGIAPDSADAYAFTSLDFEKSAVRFGKLGGFAHLRTLIERLRSDAGAGRSLLLDGGDSVAGHRPRQHPAGRRDGRGRESARHRGDDRAIGNSPMAKMPCAATSNASRANFWRRTSTSPRKPRSMTSRHSIPRQDGCSSRP